MYTVVNTFPTPSSEIVLTLLNIQILFTMPIKLILIKDNHQKNCVKNINYLEMDIMYL